ENTIRTRMHAADEFAAFAGLIAEGHGPAEVGARFGQTAKYVEQRMRLAAVSPKLLAIFRKGEMTLDMGMAFTLAGHDHKRQAKVWRGPADWKREGGGAVHAIKSALTETQIDSGNRLAKFVGLDAYRQAGGTVTQDLFRTEDDAG